MERRVCPGCGNPVFEVLGSKGSAFDTTQGGSNFHQPEYDVRACNLCGLYYKSHILNDEELTRYYQQVDFSKWDIGKLFPSEESILSVLHGLPSGSRILDYGCSDGRLLSHLKGQYEKFGCEVNEAAARIASENALTMLRPEDLRNGSSISFDAIILSDVFEHLLQPTEVLRSLRQRLASDGLLIVLTGDGDAKACQRDIPNFWYFRTAEHLCMFTKRHAEYLSKELNLKLISWTKMSHYDLPIREVIKQRVQDFAYWQFRKESLFANSILKITPVLRRARNWSSPPSITCTKDHVMAVFKRESQ